MADNFFGITDTGRQRDNNEDTFIAEEIKQGMILGAAIDGVGGYSGGEVAADIAKKTILSCINSSKGNISQVLINAIELSNKKIHEERLKVKAHDKMACVLTVVVADRAGNKFNYAHVGDTRLYLFRDETLVKVTKDHSVVGFLEESGRLTEEEAMRHPKRNEINKALGFDIGENDKDDFIETGSSPFLPGDQLLICTDGLTDMIRAKDISSILSEKGLTLEQKGKALIKVANEAAGRDNITAVLICNDKEPTAHEAVKPAMITKEVNIPPKNETEKKVEVQSSNVEQAPKKKSRGLFLVLIILVAGLVFYFVNRNKSKEPIVAKSVMPVIQNDFQNLKDSIQHSSSKVVTVYQKNIVFTDSILIDRDSIEIMGNGGQVVADSLYKGPAFVLGGKSKYVVFDSLLVTNFKTGIIVKEKGLHLRAVVFDHCDLPVKYQFLNNQDSTKGEIKGVQTNSSTDSLKARKKVK